MTLNLAALYLCAIAAVTMLGLFARHNRKIGWVKQRKTFVSDLLELQSAWDEIDQAVAGNARMGASQPISEHAKAGFSLDLSKMQNALGHETVHPETQSTTQSSANQKSEKVLV
jgi:hypothetical protein